LAAENYSHHEKEEARHLPTKGEGDTNGRVLRIRGQQHAATAPAPPIRLVSNPRLGHYSEDSMPTQARGLRVLTHYSPKIGYKRIRAVVADDIPDMQTIMICALERDGFVHIVGTADNGVTAVELAETLAPDLVVLDVNMPKMTGLEAAMLIKQSSPDTKVLVTSSDEDPELALCALACGADGFVCKSNLMKDCKSHLKRMFLQ
jgi:CheY-like chemotaxis protein